MQVKNELIEIKELLSASQAKDGRPATVPDFDEWWATTGSGLRPEPGQDHEDHARRVAAIAWATSQYVQYVKDTPRVLIVVRGGVADPIYYPNVEVAVFDWEAHAETGEGVPAHFADLAKIAGVPVEPEVPGFIDSATA